MDIKDLVDRIKRNNAELLKVACYKCGRKDISKRYKFEKAEGENAFFEWICEPCLGALEPIFRNFIKMQTVATYDNERLQGEDFTFDLKREACKKEWKCIHEKKHAGEKMYDPRLLVCANCSAYCGYVDPNAEKPPDVCADCEDNAPVQKYRGIWRCDDCFDLAVEARRKERENILKREEDKEKLPSGVCVDCGDPSVTVAGCFQRCGDCIIEREKKKYDILKKAGLSN